MSSKRRGMREESFKGDEFKDESLVKAKNKVLGLREYSLEGKGVSKSFTPNPTSITLCSCTLRFVTPKIQVQSSIKSFFVYIVDILLFITSLSVVFRKNSYYFLKYTTTS